MFETGSLPPAPTARASALLSPALALQAALFVLLGLALSLLWVVTGAGYFWPAWIWLALASALAVQVAIRLSVQRLTGRELAFAIHAAVSGILLATLVAVWALTDSPTFWPIWPLVVLGLAVGVHGVVVAMWQRLSPDVREQELAERVDVLTRTRRGALDVQAAELRRIERDLHDGAQARLVAMSLHLGRAEARLSDRPEEAELLRRARAEANAAIAELRDLARGIAPPVLADRGLAAAIEALGRRAAIPVSVDVRLDRRLPPVVEAAAYFVVAESLTNVAKHAPGADARVSLAVVDDSLLVRVSDDGPGGADPSGGGLGGLRRRVEALDGRLSIASPPSAGTTVAAELPCGS